MTVDARAAHIQRAVADDDLSPELHIWATRALREKRALKSVATREATASYPKPTPVACSRIERPCLKEECPCLPMPNC